MPRHSPSSTQEQRLSEQAFEWLIYLQDAPEDPELRSRFEAWLATSPAHREAWEQARIFWHQLDQLAPALAARSRLRPPRRSWRPLAAVACLALAAASYLLMPVGFWADERSATGERRSLTLADGSRVELGSGSALSVEFTATRREVILHGGEAYFEVAAEPGRPFVVSAGPLRSQALGTAFAVRHDDERTTVTVSQHRVRVSTEGASSTLREGQQVSFSKRRLGKVENVDLRSALAWRRDRLVFNEVPLGQVIAELGRYRPGHILITDENLTRQPVTAVFDTNDPDAVLHSIEQALPVRLTCLTEWLVLIRPMGSEPPAPIQATQKISVND
ncbi:FecR family protein [Zestomonas carbonaria]|uniref:Protein FecR n=1 Tax=Zestomonas carbonaria TaxID=2762745 RepID=A0A7U7I922_9GAMM|nr:FecR family protein [Pseudomonas carbonaria]CAD5107771.1 Protein FecR [Pseudomonas carbonaria]